MSMDAKKSNIITMVVGVVFIGLGINNILHGDHWWHYITFTGGIIILALGIYGYKTGRRF